MNSGLSKLKAGRDASASKSKFSAAESHKQNDEYMSEFSKAWHEMHGVETGDVDSEASIGANTRAHSPGLGATEQFSSYKSNLASSVVDGWFTGPVDEAGVHCRSCRLLTECGWFPLVYETGLLAAKQCKDCDSLVCLWFWQYGIHSLADASLAKAATCATCSCAHAVSTSSCHTVPHMMCH
jgi:hypothetical protein